MLGFCEVHVLHVNVSILYRHSFLFILFVVKLSMLNLSTFQRKKPENRNQATSSAPLGNFGEKILDRDRKSFMLPHD